MLSWPAARPVGVTISSGGAIELLCGQVIQSQTLSSGAIVAVGSGYVLHKRDCERPHH